MKIGHEVLSITAGRRSPGDKETWWWNDKVQEVITAKKEAMEDVGNIRKAGIDIGRKTRRQRKQYHSQGASNERVVRGAGNS